MAGPDRNSDHYSNHPLLAVAQGCTVRQDSFTKSPPIKLTMYLQLSRRGRSFVGEGERKDQQSRGVWTRYKKNWGGKLRGRCGEKGDSSAGRRWGSAWRRRGGWWRPYSGSPTPQRFMARCSRFDTVIRLPYTILSSARSSSSHVMLRRCVGYFEQTRTIKRELILSDGSILICETATLKAAAFGATSMNQNRGRSP